MSEPCQPPKEERYIIRNGRFGAYFYDNMTRKEMDLNEVKRLLNRLDRVDNSEFP